MQLLRKEVAILLCLISVTTSLAAGESTTCAKQGQPADSFQRVVSIGGSITEIIYALGCGDLVVAADISSLYPDSVLKEKANVGYKRTLSAEPILSLNPDLIFADEDSEPEAVLMQLQEAGVNVVTVPNTPTIGGIHKKIRLIANTLGIPLQGEKLILKIEELYKPVARQIESVQKTPRIMFLLTSGKGSPMAAGTDTAADNIIRLAGGNNVFNSFSGYKPVSAESIINVHPDFIVMPERVITELGGLENFINQPEIQATPAGKNKNIIVMDDLYLLGFGPRTPEAVADLATRIHPGLSAQ